MQFLSRVLLLLLFAFVIVLLNKYGPGHVIIFVSQYRLDIALSSLVIMVLVAFIILYFFIRFIRNLNDMPDRLKKWRISNQLLKSRNYLNAAGINYFEGRFDYSYKNAMHSISITSNKEIHFMSLMLAYKASSFISDDKKGADVLLQLNNYGEKKWQLAKCFSLAENQYSRGLYIDCLENLNKVLALDKKNIRARILKLDSYIHLHNYDRAFEELMWLTKNNYIAPDKADSYKLEVYGNLFAMVGDETELKHFYRKLTIVDQDNLTISGFYLNALVRLKLYRNAILFIEKKSPDDNTFYEVMISLAKVLENSDDIERLINVVTSMITKDLGNSNLLLVLGICNFGLKKYLEARQSLEDSIAFRVSLDALIYLLLVATEIKDDILRKVIENKLGLFNKSVRVYKSQ